MIRQLSPADLSNPPCNLRVIASVSDWDPPANWNTICCWPQFTLHDFLIRQMILKECIVPAHERIDVLCSDRQTMKADFKIF